MAKCVINSCCTYFPSSPVNLVSVIFFSSRAFLDFFFSCDESTKKKGKIKIQNNMFWYISIQTWKSSAGHNHYVYMWSSHAVIITTTAEDPNIPPQLEPKLLVFLSQAGQSVIVQSNHAVIGNMQCNQYDSDSHKSQQ